MNGDARRIPLADECVHCVVTSPPYWGLRDYGVEGQLGLERSVGEYVAVMVEVFREVWRVLRPEGTLWLNMGDKYATDEKWGGDLAGAMNERSAQGGYGDCRNLRLDSGCKPKDLIGLPWRVALALQADGWWLRSDIIWHKPNPMPESVRDRPTVAHEYVFLLTKSERYFYDQEAVRERQTGNAHSRGGGGTDSRRITDGGGVRGNRFYEGTSKGYVVVPGGRNRRTVWRVVTQGYKGAHFATFPEGLVEPCVKAGTSEYGVCAVCGAPWVRMRESTPEYAKLLGRGFHNHDHDGIQHGRRQDDGGPKKLPSGASYVMVGWRATCEHDAERTPAVVLDPFVGSGTTLVARRLGRDGVGLDLSWRYLAEQARGRLELDRLEGWGSGGRRAAGGLDGLPLFAGGEED